MDQYTVENYPVLARRPWLATAWRTGHTKLCQEKKRETRLKAQAALRDYDNDVTIRRHKDSSGEWFEYPVRGQWTSVDKEDFDKISPWTWYLNDHGYVVHREGGSPSKIIRLHRKILGVTNPSQHVDHRDGNPLNNRRSNIRVCTRSENVRNARKRGAGFTSSYKGVWFDLRKSLWCADIWKDSKKHYLGCSFETQEDAAYAYNLAAAKLHGEFACLNKLPLGYTPRVYPTPVPRTKKL